MAELYSNVTLNEAEDTRERRLGEFIEDEELRQELMDSLMKHEEMLFKTIQAAFEEWL